MESSMILKSYYMLMIIILICDATGAVVVVSVHDDNDNFTGTTEVLYECNNFVPNINCGHDVNCDNNNNTNKSSDQWIIRNADELLDVIEVDPDGILDYVLLFLNGSSGSYQLNGPLLLPRKFCIKYELIHSEYCHTNSDPDRCHTDVSLKGHPINDQPSTGQYRDSGWIIIYSQFELDDYYNGFDFDWPIIINAYIDGETNSDIENPNKVPYIAFRKIQIQNGTCPELIGPRKSFWIAMMVVFTISSSYIFIHFIFNCISAREKRRKLFLLNEQDNYSVSTISPSLEQNS